ncbi:MAG: glycoside hydrolase TIM-barrel-like domain-containing protein, partial [Pseudomonadota bacterium]
MTTLAVKGIQSFARGGVKALTSLAVSTATNAITRALDNRVFEGPRLETFLLQTSRDGAPLPRVFGRVRLAGEVIWASQVRETQTDQSVGGKGGGPTQLDYSYSISFAVSLCEGEILGVERIWANGEVLQRGDLTIRIHTGSETQGPDPVIAATEAGDIPAFRGTAYIVFEDFPLDDYGARLPSINAEVVRGLRGGGRMEEMIQSVNLLPGSGEFALSPTIVEETPAPGKTIPSNMNNLSGQADLLTSLDQLQAELPNCRHVSLISSWFGTSLDAGECEIHPGAERLDRILPDATWSVAGQMRSSAYIVSADEDGRANYGGTPSDDSVIACIQTLKQRGFAVTLYPFLLMDAPNFPWRGRIAAQSDADVISFFGTDKDFQFRHSILHHARLAQAAGGVDAIVIGTELRTLTTFREGERFPVVEQLQALAADVRAIVGPSTKITYAADWSEYFGVQNGGDVRYHLDPLWADPNIDAVGIDAYFPLSDWRDGSHLDKQTASRIHDLDYLRANVEGGEEYDWYYASPEDRDAQTRTPIDDPAYRYKDVRHWWCTAHEERRNGSVIGQSPWVPRSKPIWLMEIGCPAVNKGANQPNVFYDPKSSESALPYYSDGTRDDLVQRRYIEALLTHYGETNETGFLDLSRASVWAWDARPYPDFPARTEVWSDGPNWSLGHWLNGRTGLMPVADVIAELISDAGLETFDVSGVSGVLPGYIVDRPMSARAALGPLLQLY